LDVLLKISIVLVVGIVGGKIAKLLKLPNVSGYLVAGLLLGPSFFKLVSAGDIDSFAIISEIALAVIAFSIGSEFKIHEMKKIGKKVLIITLLEVIGAIGIVFSVMYFGFGQPFAFSIVIASMSAATAPAATLLVMRQYRSHGPLTKTILPVVALDDVFGIMAFGIAISLAKISISSTDLSLFQMITGPIIEILGSVLLGFTLGFILSKLAKRAKNKDETQIISLAAIGVATALANVLDFSPLLTNIVMGTVLVNLYQSSNRVFGSVNDFIAPFYVLFFTLAGASLDLSILASVGMMGLAYILARGGGKMIGAWVGGKATNAEKTVTKYLGLALLPQGGISIGLSVLVRQQLPEYAVAITTIIMFSVLIYEVSGPIFAKIAIQKAGEIDGLDKLVIESQPLQPAEQPA
jgi:Kef-type K+ transport system membrane component KefB